MAGTYTVERSITIAAPPEAVYPHLASFHRWQAWSPWEGRHPQQERRYSGPEAGVGARYAWSGNRAVGQGSMEIVDAAEPSTVGIDLRFDKPFKSRNDTRFTVAPDGSGSRVVWTMTGEHNLLTKVLGLVWPMDKMIGKDFDQGLAQLKATVENATT
jgi:hypothetical protein